MSRWTARPAAATTLATSVGVASSASEPPGQHLVGTSAAAGTRGDDVLLGGPGSDISLAPVNCEKTYFPVPL